MSLAFLTSLSEQEFKEFLRDALKEILSEQSTTSKETFPENLRVKQAARFLNMEVTTLYEKTSRKLIPHYKKGNKLYFHLSELKEWILKGKVKTRAEIEGEAITYTLASRQNEGQ